MSEQQNCQSRMDAATAGCLILTTNLFLLNH